MAKSLSNAIKSLNFFGFADSHWDLFFNGVDAHKLFGNEILENLLFCY